MRNHLIALSTHRTRASPYDVSIVVGHGVKASVETQLDLLYRVVSVKRSAWVRQQVLDLRRSSVGVKPQLS